MSANLSCSTADLVERHSDRRSLTLSPGIVAGLLAVADGLATYFSGVLAYLAHPGWNTAKYPTYLAAITIDVLILVGLCYFARLYQMKAILYPQKQLSKIMLLSALGILVLIAFAFALKISEEFSRLWCLTFYIATVTFVYLGRVLSHQALLRWARAGWLTRNVAVVGAGEQGARLVERLRKRQDPWLRIVGIFDDRASRVPPEIDGCRVSGNVDSLVLNARVNRIDDILVALPWGADQRVFNILEKLQVLPVDVRLSPDMVGLNFPYHGYSYYSGVPALNVFDKPLSGWNYVLKTIEDTVLTLLILALVSPVMMLIALLIKLDSAGPVVFRQKRYGFNNQLIEVYKFRTMYVDQQDDNARQLTTRNDPRVTRIGRFLRRTSLDELPQFFNVLKGDMSIVGPRPHATEAKAAGVLYENLVDHYAVRHKVKPGITGWAQVNGWRGETDTEEKIRKRVEHDISYINNWSILLDLKIILKTIWVSLLGKEAY